MFVPAICDACGNIFPSGIEVHNATNMSLSGARSRCPRCGEWGRIPDGVYDFVDNTVRIIAAPEQSRQDWARFSRILRDLYERKAEPDEIRSTIEKELPGFSSVAQRLPMDKRKALAFVLFTLWVLHTLLGIAGDAKDLLQDDEQVQRITQVVIEQATINVDLPPEQETPGRNDPCWCGSGKKYKRCHGAPQENP